MKVGSKAKDCEVFSRDPVLKFEGFGKRHGNFHPFPCALDGSTPQQAPSFDVSIGGSTPHSSSRRLKATACLKSETSLNAGTAAEYKCETGGQYLATGSDEQHASVLDFSSCFESVESVQCRVSRVNAMLSPARHLTPVEHSLTARGGACGVALCCSRCGSVLVDGESDTCGRCMLGTHGCDMFNSCVEHGDGQVARRVHQGVGETKSKRTRTGSRVWQSLEGLMPVGDELATDPRRVSGKVHVETRDGRSSATRYGTRLVEFGEGCEVVVKIPCVPEKALMVGVFVTPRPGVPLRETWGWKPLLHTPSCGVWVLSGALQSIGFLDLLGAAASWVGRSTYRTAWAVCPWSGCQCSYSYGQGPAIGPHTGQGCWRYLVSVWRALAPLLSPWCADGDVPSAANLNLYEGSRSHVNWHCDDESLFGGIGDSKLIVSLSLGSSVTFKWKAKSCSESEGNSCRLHHGDLLVMDGRCQDEYLHCTSPGLAEKRMNITYRWIRHHTFGCPLAAGVLGSLPACAKGSSVLGPGSKDSSVPELVYLGLLVVLFCGLLIGLARLAFYRTRFGGLSLLYRQFCPLGDYCWFWRVWPVWQQSWVHMGWTRGVGRFLGFWDFCVWLPCMLAWWRLLSLSGRDACLVIKLTRAPGEKSGLKHGKTSLSPSSVFLVSSHSLKFYWGCLVWHLWLGRARHPGPGSVGIEVFNVGGWLTNGDFAADTSSDFLCVTEHRLVSARARSEWRRLRDKRISSIWSPASQESSVVGNAGVGVISLKGAPLALPTFATPGFERFFGLGRAVLCLVPLGCRRFMHLVVLYGYFGADSCSEKLQLTNQLFEAALGELAVVARGQPCLIVGDFNVEPTKIPCLAKGISAGLWVDLEASWAAAAGRDPAVTCKRTWDSDSGNRRDFQIGCPLCAAAVLSCEVLCDRWIQPHLAVRTWFVADRWTALVTQVRRFTPLWPASWVSSVDRSRCSKSAEVRRIWDVYDERLGWVDADDALSVDHAIASGDVSSAWLAWSGSAERALLSAFCLAGGPVPEKGFCLGRGLARFNKVRLGGPKVSRTRARCSDPGDGALVDLYRDHSVAPLVDLRRRLRAVLDIIAAIGRSGFTVSRGLELTRQWSSIVAIGPQGNITADDLARISGLGLAGMEASVVDLHHGLNGLLQNIVRRRRDRALLGWKAWILEDPSSHPYRWLRPDLIPPSPFLQCDPRDTVDGSGVIADPALIDAKFREAWMPYFSRSSRGSADLDDFSQEVAGGWLPVLDVFHLPPLTGDVLAEVVRGRNLLLVVWMAGVGESLKLFLSLGLMVLLAFFAWLRRPVFGLMACLMPMSL